MFDDPNYKKVWSNKYFLILNMFRGFHARASPLKYIEKYKPFILIHFLGSKEPEHNDVSNGNSK